MGHQRAEYERSLRRGDLSHDTSPRTGGGAACPVALVAHFPESGVVPIDPVHGPVLLQDNCQISLLHGPTDVMLRGDRMVLLCPIGQRTQLVALWHAFHAELQALVAVQVAPGCLPLGLERRRWMLSAWGSSDVSPSRAAGPRLAREFLEIP